MYQQANAVLVLDLDRQIAVADCYLDQRAGVVSSHFPFHMVSGTMEREVGRGGYLGYSANDQTSSLGYLAKNIHRRRALARCVPECLHRYRSSWWVSVPCQLMMRVVPHEAT